MKMEKIKKLHPQIKSNIRYKLSSKMMQENFVYWLNLPTTSKILKKLFENLKKNNITISAPNPFFPNNIKNSLTSSQIAAAHFIPPVSPNSITGQSMQAEKKNSMNDDPQKKMTESLTNSMMSSMKLSTIPKFYFPSVGGDIIQQENAFIDSVFKN